MVAHTVMVPQKTKILYIVTKSNFGGAQRYIYDLATHLPKTDFTVTVAFGGKGTLKEKLEEENIRTISLPYLGRNVRFFDDIRAFFSLLYLFLSETPDIIHLNSSKVGVLGSLAARTYNILQSLKTRSCKLKTKIIFTAHGWAFNEDRPFVQKMIIRFLSWVTVICSHAVIAVSDFHAQQGRAMPFSSKKIIAIQNGIRVPHFLPRKQARTELLGTRVINIPKDALWVGVIAELTKNKGLSFAISGIHRLVLDEKLPRPIVYVIIGEGEEERALSSLIAEMELTNIVFLAGVKKDAATLLQAFDLFLFPSIKEGLPYVLLEASEAGLPVITTPVGGIPEIIRDMETGILIRPKEVLEIKKAISFALTHEETMRMLGSALKRYVNENFSFEKMLTKTKQLYHDGK